MGRAAAEGLLCALGQAPQVDERSAVSRDGGHPSVPLLDPPELNQRRGERLAQKLLGLRLRLRFHDGRVGLAGAGDPDNRRMMNFDPYLSANQSELLGRVRAIGQARASSDALRRGERTTVWVDDDLYVYTLTDGDDVAVVALHKGWGDRTETITLGLEGLDGVTLTDAAFDRTAAVIGDQLTLTLGSWDYALFVL